MVGPSQESTTLSRNRIPCWRDKYEVPQTALRVLRTFGPVLSN